MLIKPNTLQKMAKEHPWLLQAMENLLAAVHEEKPSKDNKGGDAAIPTAFAYHLVKLTTGHTLSFFSQRVLLPGRDV